MQEQVAWLRADLANDDAPRRQAERDEQYVTGILECCRYYRKALEEGRDAFEHAIAAMEGGPTCA